MSETRDEVTTALKELHQVCDAINGGSDYFESQLASASQIGGVTESVKLYATEVLQTATQHLVNMAELMEEDLLQQTSAVSNLDRQCNSIIQDALTRRAKVEIAQLSALQTQLPMQA